MILSNSTSISAADLVYDDFNDGEMGTNLGGLVGTLSPDIDGDNVGDYDPTINFTENSYEGNYAMSITYSTPSGKWSGYWSYANDTDPNSPPQSTIDVSGYTELRLMARGTKGTEQLKIELVSGPSESSYKYVTVPGTSWGEIVVPLSSFTKVAWVVAPVDLSRLRQINIVFDRSPYSSTVYIDFIRFTGGTAALRPPAAQFTYSPGSPTAGTEVTFNASGSSDEDGTITSYFWNFGDGTTGSGVRVTHTYSTSGNYNVTLTVTDNDGLTSGLTRTLTVGPRSGGVTDTGNAENNGTGTEEETENGRQSGTTEGHESNQANGESNWKNDNVIVPAQMTIMGVVVIGVMASIIAYIIRKRNNSESPHWG